MGDTLGEILITCLSVPASPGENCLFHTYVMRYVVYLVILMT